MTDKDLMSVGVGDDIVGGVVVGGGVVGEGVVGEGVVGVIGVVVGVVLQSQQQLHDDEEKIIIKMNEIIRDMSKIFFILSLPDFNNADLSNSVFLQ
jgi:hypothetical protein